MADSIVVKAKIKEAVKDCNVSGDFADALNDALVEQVQKAVERAKGNGRKTVQAKDVIIGESQAGPMLVVRSKIKGLVSDVNVSGDLADALNSMALWMIAQAEARAESNNRKTMMGKDL